MTDITARLDRLERDLAEVRDRLAIYQLTATYGPAVDAGDSVSAAALWTDDGVYDWGRGMTTDSASSASGRAALVEIFEGTEHQGIIQGGSAHWLSLPHVVIDGDEATSLCYSSLFLRTKDGFAPARVSVCLFEWRRVGAGWEISRRRNRSLDGSEAARTLIAEGLRKAQPT